MQLEQEKARLNRELRSEKSNAQKTTGEITTLRRRLEVVNRENAHRLRESETKLQELNHSNAEALKKHADELQRLKQQNEQAKTNNVFAAHEQMADRVTRAQKNQVSIRTRQPTVAASPSTTPKKQQKHTSFHNGMGDGFDEDDMAFASPAKTREKSKAFTPKQVSKRKRPVGDQSPIPILQLSEPRERPQPEKSNHAISGKLDNELLENLQKDDHRFQLLFRLVNNRSSNGRDRVLEALAQHSFPSNPDKKLSSIVYDELLRCSLRHNVHELAIHICHIFFGLWQKCHEETYYEPIYLFLDALQFIIACEPASTAISLIERAVPIITASIDLVSVPISKAAFNQVPISELFSPEQRAISASIDVVDCLDLLYVLASSCIASPPTIDRFWQLVDHDFILVLIRSKQPLPHLQAILRLLSTSALPSSLGSIAPPEIRSAFQQRSENQLIERLTQMLSANLTTIPDPSEPDSSPHTYTPQQTLSFRLQIIRLLTSFSILPYGNSLLVSNRDALGHLILFLHSQITTLYSPSPPSLPLPPKSTLHTLTTTAINMTFKLIYHLITSAPHTLPNDYSEFIASKLKFLPGGYHRFLVAVSRIAYCEGLVLEEGIEGDVARDALELLDGWLGPQEGGAVMEVFDPGSSAGVEGEEMES